MSLSKIPDDFLNPCSYRFELFHHHKENNYDNSYYGFYERQCLGNGERGSPETRDCPHCCARTIYGDWYRCRYVWLPRCSDWFRVCILAWAGDPGSRFGLVWDVGWVGSIHFPTHFQRDEWFRSAARFARIYTGEFCTRYGSWLDLP